MGPIKDIDFTFKSATSGSFEKLLSRLNITQDEAVELALTYYGLYLNGTKQHGRLLFIVNTESGSGCDLDDEVTPQHRRVGMVTATYDQRIIDGLTRIGEKDSPEDMLTSAFVLLEKVCDAEDTGWKLYLCDYSKMPPEAQPLNLSTFTDDITPEDEVQIARATAPRGPYLH